MKLIKTVKKIMALSTGAVMVGATVLSASAAADLAGYPAPFVKDGKFNGILVVGDAANAADVLGSVDIATSLQFASRIKKSVSTSAGSQISVSGEAWRIGTSSKKLEMSESVGAGSSLVSENIRNITTFISDDELTGLLADDTFRNAKGDYDYHQYLYFDPVNAQDGTNPASLSVTFAEDPDTDVTGDYFYIKNNDRVARYSLEFTSSAESDITDSAGSASTSGTYLWSMEGKTINMLGKTFSIVKARRSSANGNSAELTLMGGAVQDTLNEGESKTYTIGGKEYDLKLDFVGTTTTKFVINGEITDSLQEGDTYTLSDKSQVGIKDISVQDFAGGVRKTEFYLGADKIFLKDTDVNAAGAGSQTLEVGSEKIDDTKVTITGTDDNTTFKIDTIELNITADDDIYIPAGGKLSGQLEEPQVLLNAWDIEYQGLDNVPVETYKLDTSGSNQYDIVFVDGDGKSASIPLAYTSTGTTLKLGDNNDDLILVENNGALGNNNTAIITRNDYFLVTDKSQQQGSRRTYLLRYKGSSATSDSSPVIKFQNVGSGETLERPLAATGLTVPFTGTAAANIQLGGATYNVYNASLSTSGDFDILVDMDGDGSLSEIVYSETDAGNGTEVGNNVINVTTRAGMQIVIKPVPFNATLGSVQAPTHIEVSFQTVDADDYDNVAPSPIDFNISAASAEVQFSEDTSNVNQNYISPEEETNTNYGYTTMGAKIKWENPTNSPDKLTIEYPTVQRLPLIYITSPEASISTGEATEAGQIVYYETQPIAVGSAKLAGEITDIAAQNAIIVGGPCANAAAAEVMGFPEPCGKDFSVGKAVVRLYEQANGNVAMLVAGYEAADTRRAARVVANYEDWQTAGKLQGLKVEVSGTSFSDISVAAIDVKAEADAAAAAAAATTTTTTTTTTTE
ncbi:S-layer protein [Candidatus Woesearchaeota archaeon]|nr:S-layer protein [Candidatus Woesearchaeota archaeon]